MSEKDTAPSGGNGGEERCSKCGELFDTRGIKQHVAACDGVQSESSDESEDSEARNQDEPPAEFFTEEFWEKNASWFLTSKGQEPREDEPAHSSAARQALKSLSAGADEWTEMFGTCANPDCNRGCNGFHTDYCGKPSHHGETEDDSSDDGSASEGEISLDDLSQDQKEELVTEVVENL